jgi:hypothetical protein
MKLAKCPTRERLPSSCVTQKSSTVTEVRPFAARTAGIQGNCCPQTSTDIQLCSTFIALIHAAVAGRGKL